MDTKQVSFKSSSVPGRRLFAALFGAMFMLVIAGCMPALHVFYYKVPDNPLAGAEIRDCQRTSLMSDVDQWAVMGSCLNTMPDVSWYYGTLKAENCSAARTFGDAVGWVLYDCYEPSNSMERMKGAEHDGNKPGVYLYNTMVETTQAPGGQKALPAKSK